MISRRKRFLLILVVASLVCLLLLQVSSDFTQKGSRPLPEIAVTTSNANIQSLIKHHSNINITIHSQSKHHDTIVTTPLLIARTTKRTSNVTALDKVPIRKLQNNDKIHQQLMSRHDRLQDILKQSTNLRKPFSDPMKSLRSIPLVDPKRVKRIFVLTYFRSGSTFFGDILQQNWKTFYHFEPLHSMTYDKRVGDESIEDVFSLFDDLFHCNFTNAKDYMQWVRKPRNQFLFSRNLFLWVTCHGNPKACFDPAFVNAVCARSPVHVAKVTRLQMRHLRSYLQNHPQSAGDYKVVYLSRDPRGILSSRWSLDWCNASNCSDPSVLCNEMDEDLKVFEEMRKQRARDFIQVRYEDLSLNPESETKKLMEFLELPYSPSVQRFLKTHTVGGHKADDKNPYSTRRNSSSMVSSWRERFTFKQVVDVQRQCQKVLQTLNHSMITKPEQLPFPLGKPNVTTSTTSPILKNPGWRYHKNPLAQKYLANKDKSLWQVSAFTNKKEEFLRSTADKRDKSSRPTISIAVKKDESAKAVVSAAYKKDESS